MRTIVDTPVWSELFRRQTPQLVVVDRLKELIQSGEAIMLGPIRQEILSSVKDPTQYTRLRDALRAFPDQPILTKDYEAAANCFNACRAKGIQGSNTDFLICAVAKRLGAVVFTLDQDLAHYAQVLGVAVC